MRKSNEELPRDLLKAVIFAADRVNSGAWTPKQAHEWLGIDERTPWRRFYEKQLALRTKTRYNTST